MLTLRGGGNLLPYLSIPPSQLAVLLMQLLFCALVSFNMLIFTLMSFYFIRSLGRRSPQMTHSLPPHLQSWAEAAGWPCFSIFRKELVCSRAGVAGK